MKFAAPIIVLAGSVLLIGLLLARSPIRAMERLEPPVGDVVIDREDGFEPVWPGLPIDGRAHPENRTYQFLPRGEVQIPAPYVTWKVGTNETFLGYLSFARPEDVPLPDGPGELVLYSALSDAPITGPDLPGSSGVEGRFQTLHGHEFLEVQRAGNPHLLLIHAGTANGNKLRHRDGLVRMPYRLPKRERPPATWKPPPPVPAPTLRGEIVSAETFFGDASKLPYLFLIHDRQGHRQTLILTGDKDWGKLTGKAVEVKGAQIQSAANLFFLVVPETGTVRTLGSTLL